MIFGLTFFGEAPFGALPAEGGEDLIQVISSLVSIPRAIVDIVRLYLFPQTDVTDGSWTNELDGTDLAPSIDEPAFDDDDYIKSSSDPVADEAVISLNVPDYTLVAPIVLRVRAKKAGNVGLTITLRVDAVDIFTSPISPDILTEAYQTLEFTLDETQSQAFIAGAVRQLVLTADSL